MNALERLRASVDGSLWAEVESRDGDPCVEVAREHALEVLGALRDEAGFEVACFVTAIDRSPADPRFEVHWGLLSVSHADRIRVRTRVGEADASVPSVVALWPGTAFAERECYDMFGIGFTGHAGLKRLLMPDEYTHHPLRKDFPHQGIEPDRLYREWERSRTGGGR